MKLVRGGQLATCVRVCQNSAYSVRNTAEFLRRTAHTLLADTRKKVSVQFCTAEIIQTVCRGRSVDRSRSDTSALQGRRRWLKQLSKTI